MLDTLKTNDLMEIETIVTYGNFVDTQEWFYISVPYKNRTYEQVIYDFLLKLINEHEKKGWHASSICKISTCANWKVWEEHNRLNLSDDYHNGKFVFSKETNIYDALSYYERKL
jgi:hypothetical protein